MPRVSSILLLSLLVPFVAEAQDTLVVRADNPPLWGVAPRLVEELRIGVLEGDPRYQFGYIAGVVEAADGGVWIADRTLGAIRRYSPTGEHIGDVGRKGGGPGEFNYIVDMRRLPDGRVAVLDPMNGRIHVFDAEGHLTGAFRSPVNGAVWPLPLEVDTAGRLYLRDVDRAAGEGSPRRWFWIRLSPAGEIADTVFRAPPRIDGRISTQPLISPLGYRVDGRNSEYAFHRPLRDGRTVRIERSWTPVPYAADEREELQKREDATAEFRSAKPLEVPHDKLPWSSFHVDADGRIWVARSAPATKDGETAGEEHRRQNVGRDLGIPVPAFPPITWKQPAVYDVIETTGRFLGTVTVPNGVRAESGGDRVAFALARGMTLWMIEKGEYDEQYVVKYNIIPGP